MKGTLKRSLNALLSAILCAAMCISGLAVVSPETVYAASADSGSEKEAVTIELKSGGNVHDYGKSGDDPATEEDESQTVYSADYAVNASYGESTKYSLTANQTDISVYQYRKGGNPGTAFYHMDVARFSSDDPSAVLVVSVKDGSDISNAVIYPEVYYPEGTYAIDEENHTITIQMSKELGYCILDTDGDNGSNSGDPQLAIINDPTETGKPDINAGNVLNFKEFSDAYLKAHPITDTVGEVCTEAGSVTDAATGLTWNYGEGHYVAYTSKGVAFPNKRARLSYDVTEAFQAALEEVRNSETLDTIYFPAGTYVWSGLQISGWDGAGKDGALNIYVDEDALLVNRLQECKEAMEPAIGIRDSSNITISGRGIFDGNGVYSQSMDSKNADQSGHQGGCMVVRSEDITFNDTYLRDAKQWNWECHSGIDVTYNNIKGLSPYQHAWVDGLDLTSGQNVTVNGALTMGNDDCFASGHYNPSDGFGTASQTGNESQAVKNLAAAAAIYNGDRFSWDQVDSYGYSINNTLGWSTYASGIKLGHSVCWKIDENGNKTSYTLKDYTFNNVNTVHVYGTGSNAGGGGIQVRNGVSNGYPGYENIVFKNCSFTAVPGSSVVQIPHNSTNYFYPDTVTLENCWFNDPDASFNFASTDVVTVSDLYLDGELVEYTSQVAMNVASTVREFIFLANGKDVIKNEAPQFTAPAADSYEAKAGEAIGFTVAAADADGDEVTLSADGLPDGAEFDTKTGAFTWTPTTEQMGQTKVTFTAADTKKASITKTVTFTINDKVGNTAPEFDELESPYSVNAGEKLTFTVGASDADGDEVTLSVSGDLPRGASFDADTGVFTWVTNASQTGSREITFKAVDQWGASAEATVTVNVETGEYVSIEVSPTGDTYLSSWKTEKNNNYNDSTDNHGDWLRVCRMSGSASDPGTYGLWGEKITSTSDAGDAKITVLKFDAAELLANLDKLEKAELELTLIHKRYAASIGTDRLMAVEASGEWDASDVTWNARPDWGTDNVKYSDPFDVTSTPVTNNKYAITNSGIDGTKVTIDVTEFVKNLAEDAGELSIAVCDENGYELAFASTEGAVKLGESAEAAPVLRLTVTKENGPEVEVGSLTVSEDSYVGSWSGDQTKSFAGLNYLRAAYSDDSQGVLGSEGGNDNKLTYLKFDLADLDADTFDRVYLNLSLLGVRLAAAVNQDITILAGVADDTEWTESTLTWNSKPSVVTGESALAVSETATTGSVYNNDPSKISTVDGTTVTTDVTEFVKDALAEGKETLTLAVNIDNSNAVMTAAKANRIYFVSKEGSEYYSGAEDMAPKLVLTKYSSEDEALLTGIEVTEPVKTSYKLGDEFDTTGMTVTAVYNDGNTKAVDLSEVEISGFDSEEIGKKTIIVSYGGKTAAFKVAVVDYKSFLPNTEWLDTDGDMIQAHGGGIIWDEATGKYYWYGENKGEAGFSAAIGVSCYSSTDLYNWTYEGMALPVFNNAVFDGEEGTDYTDETPLYLAESSEEYQTLKASGASVSTYDTLEKYNTAEQITALNALYQGLSASEKQKLYDSFNWNGVVERPKVIYNEKTGKYVMWFHLDGEGVGTYNLAQTGVAVSDSPTGPFKLVNTLNPNGCESRDMTLFVDDDGTAYLLYSSEDNNVLHIAELTEDYTDLTGRYSRNYVYSSGSKGIFAREAPAIFKYDGYYYLISSGCTGWNANAMGYSVTDDITAGMGTVDSTGGNGPFQFENNQALNSPCIGTDASTSFGGQSTYVLPVQGKDGCFIYMADKWNSGNLMNSRYQWLPIQIDSENRTLTLSWSDEWTLDDFESLNTEARRAMNAAVKEANALDSTEFKSEDRWNALEELVKEAANLSYSAEEDEVNGLTQSIRNAVDELVRWKELDAAVSAVENLFKAEYTEATWQTVQEAYDAAIALDDNASAAEIQAAAEAVNAAIAKLVKAAVDLEELDLTSETVSIIADSQQTSAGNQAEKAIDGDSSTIWHSAWGTGATELPHYVTIDLGEAVENLYQLSYLPRQDKDNNGIATKYRILVSNSDKSLEELTEDDFTEVRSGTWEYDKSEKTTVFTTDGAVRYVRFVVTEGYGGYASAAEIRLFVNNAVSAEPADITVNAESAKTEYKLGEDLSLEGLVLTVIYDDGSTVEMTDLTDVAVSGFDTAKTGTQTVTVTWQGMTADYEITVLDEIAEGLALQELILTAPNKVQYLVGEELDLTGMAVTAVYEKGITRDVTADVTVSGFDSSEAAEAQTVTVSYKEQTAQFSVSVSEIEKEPELVRIEVTAPDKTEYESGEALDLSGMKAVAVYSDGTIVELDPADVEVSGYDPSAEPGDQTVTVSYQGMSAAFTVSMKAAAEPEKTLQGISIESEPSVVEYYVGEALELTGLKVLALYSDGSSEDVTAQVQVTGYDSSEAGEVTVTVSYEDMTAEFTVTIVEKPDLGDDNNDPENNKPGTDDGNGAGDNGSSDKINSSGSGQNTDPASSANAQSSQTSKAAKTGDANHAAVYLMLLALAAVIAVIAGKKYKYKK